MNPNQTYIESTNLKGERGGTKMKGQTSQRKQQEDSQEQPMS